MGRVVLVTGVCGELGGRFARRLAADPAVEEVIGLDAAPPRAGLGDVRFVQTDMCSPVAMQTIAADGVDTVVHLGEFAPANADGLRRVDERNVIATMQLLTACQQTPGVQRLIVKSSAAFYGSSAQDPAIFTEDMSPRQLSGSARHWVAVEDYVRGFARRRPDVHVTVLRSADIIGPAIDTAMTRYLQLPVVPTVLGFDPRLQFCHEQDALEILHHSTLAGVPGTFNVAGDHVLTLAQAVRRLGRPDLGFPPSLLGLLGSLIPQLRRADLSPTQISYLTHGRGLDTAAMRQTLGFEPKFTTPEALDDFARSSGPGAVHPERVDELERHIAAIVSRVGTHGQR